MKKLFPILAAMGLFIACNNDAATESSAAPSADHSVGGGQSNVHDNESGKDIVKFAAG